MRSGVILKEDYENINVKLSGKLRQSEKKQAKFSGLQSKKTKEEYAKELKKLYDVYTYISYKAILDLKDSNQNTPNSISLASINLRNSIKKSILLSRKKDPNFNLKASEADINAEVDGMMTSGCKGTKFEKKFNDIKSMKVGESFMKYSNTHNNLIYSIVMDITSCKKQSKDCYKVVERYLALLEMAKEDRNYFLLSAISAALDHELAKEHLSKDYQQKLQKKIHEEIFSFGGLTVVQLNLLKKEKDKEKAREEVTGKGKEKVEEKEENNFFVPELASLIAATEAKEFASEEARKKKGKAPHTRDQIQEKHDTKLKRFQEDIKPRMKGITQDNPELEGNTNQDIYLVLQKNPRGFHKILLDTTLKEIDPVGLANSIKKMVRVHNDFFAQEKKDVLGALLSIEKFLMSLTSLNAMSTTEMTYEYLQSLKKELEKSRDELSVSLDLLLLPKQRYPEDPKKEKKYRQFYDEYAAISNRVTNQFNKIIGAAEDVAALLPRQAVAETSKEKTTTKTTTATDRLKALQSQDNKKAEKEPTVMPTLDLRKVSRVHDPRDHKDSPPSPPKSDSPRVTGFKITVSPRRPQSAKATPTEQGRKRSSTIEVSIIKPSEHSVKSEKKGGSDLTKEMSHQDPARRIHSTSLSSPRGPAKRTRAEQLQSELFKARGGKTASIRRLDKVKAELSSPTSAGLFSANNNHHTRKSAKKVKHEKKGSFKKG